MKCFFENPNLSMDEFYQAYLERAGADWDRLYQDYDAAVDFTGATFYKDLFSKYPDAKVILTVRSPDGWYKSVKNTICRAASAVPFVEPGTPAYSFGRLSAAVCMDGRIFNPELFKDEEKMKALYLEHNEEVKKTIPKDQLLVVELGEGWERICKFLDKDVPTTTYPSSNSTADFERYFIRGERPDGIVANDPSVTVNL